MGCNPTVIVPSIFAGNCWLGPGLPNGKAPANFPSAKSWVPILKSEAKAKPGDAIILGLVWHDTASVKEYSHMRGETILHAGTSLTKPEFGLIKLVPATAKHIGSQSTLAKRKPQNQIGRSADDESASGIFRISLGPNADIARRK